MTIGLNISSPSEIASKSTTPNLAYRHRPLLADAQFPDSRQSGSYRDVLVSREDTRLASLGALGVCLATPDPVWHSSVIAVTSEPLGETTRLAQFSPDPFLPMNSIPIVAISP